VPPTDEPVFEMLWDCGFSGSRGLLGKTHRHCPACGGPQAPDARYFPNEDQKVAVEAHEFVGADRVCANCQTASAATAAFCGTGGAPLGDDDAEVRRVADAVVGAAPAPPPDAGAGPAAARRPRWPWIAGVLAVVAVAAVALTWTRTDSAQVTGHKWSRVVEVEQFRTVQQDSWCDAMPRDARDVRRSRKQRGTRRVADGEDCTTTDGEDDCDSEQRESKRVLRHLAPTGSTGSLRECSNNCR